MDYSAVHWASHFREAGISSDDELTTLAAALCDATSPKNESWLVGYQWQLDIQVFEFSNRLSIATYLGLDPVMRRLINAEKVDVNTRDF